MIDLSDDSRLGLSMSYLTPPDSLSGSSPHEAEDDKGTFISVSTTFYPRDDPQTDVMILSSDGVFFSVHRAVLLKRSTNAFAGLLDDPELSFQVPQSSDVLNILLHAIYDLDPSGYSPTLDLFNRAFAHFTTYGLAVSDSVTKSKPIYNIILRLGHAKALEAYALAAHYGLEDLAVEVSHHLLAVPLSSLDDAICVKMGPAYLRRLVFLHLGRTARLKQLLLQPPTPHSPTFHCDAIDQRLKLESAWREASGALSWDANAATSISLLQLVLGPIADTVSCQECKTAVRERIRKLIIDWTSVKTTI